MNKKSNEKKYTFSEQIDSSINGFSVVLAFIIIGVLLQFDNSFFGNATSFIQIVFIIVGILGLVTEIRNLNANYNIAGVDNIVSGLILLILSYLLKTFINPDNWINFASRIYELLLFFLILFSIYGICRGVIEMCYSIYKDYREKKKKGKLFSSVMAILTQLFGLALVVAQIYDIFNK